MKRFFTKLITNLIPVKSWRKSIRNKILGKVPAMVEPEAKFDWKNFYYDYCGAIADPHGLGMADFMIKHSLHIESRYKNMFYNMPENSNIIDCGVNRGKFVDLCNLFGAKITGFEPNLNLFSFVKYKYRDNHNVNLINAGVSDAPGEMDFFYDKNDTSDTSFSIYTSVYYPQKEVTSVKCKLIDLCEYIKTEYIDHGKRVYMLKIDIEGAEFGLIEKICETEVYKHCDYIVVETHARFFPDGDERMEKMVEAINKSGATNIDLGWV